MELAPAERGLCNSIANRMTRPLGMIILAGLLIRIIIMPLLSFDFDISFWVATGQGFEGGRDIYETSYYWYTPVWGYIIAIMTGIGNLFGMSMSGEVLGDLISSAGASTLMNTTVTTIGTNVLYKFPLLIIDFIAACLIYGIVEHFTIDKKKATIAFGLWFLCPLVIWSSSVACMFDSLSAMFALLGFFFLLKGNYLLSGPSFILAISSKIFPLCLMLVVIAYMISKHKEDIHKLFKNIGQFFFSGLAMLLIIYMPVILTGNLSKSFEFFYSRSASASDSSWNLITILSEISYNQVIQFAPILAIFLILIGIWMYRSKSEERDKNLIIASLLSFTVMFIWPPTPTYPIVMIPFLALAITVCGKKDLLWSWVLFSTIMTLVSVFTFNLQTLYSLAVYTDLFDINALVTAMFNNSELFLTMERIFRYLEFIPGISVLLILYRYRRKRIEDEKVTGGVSVG